MLYCQQSEKLKAERLALTLQRDPTHLATIDRETLALKKAAAESGSVTDAAMNALTESDADIDATTESLLKTELIADNLLVVRNFASAAASGVLQLSSDMWNALRTNLPQGVGDAARVAPILGLIALVTHLTGPIGGIAAAVSGFGSVVRALHHLRRSDGHDINRQTSLPEIKTLSGSGYYRNLGQHLIEAGLGVTEVALQSGLSRNTVLRARACQRPVASVTVSRIIDALNVLYYNAHPPPIKFSDHFDLAVANY